MLTPHPLSLGSEAEFNVVAGGISTSTVSRRTYSNRSWFEITSGCKRALRLLQRHSTSSYRHPYPRGYGDIVCRPTALWFDTEGHLDNPENVHANAFVSELQIHDLVERVQQPTHCKGHQPDVFITCADDPTTSIRINQPSQLSDHSLIVASFHDVDTASTVARERSRVQRRRWRNFDIDRFKADLQQSELV